LFTVLKSHWYEVYMQQLPLVYGHSHPLVENQYMCPIELPRNHHFVAVLFVLVFKQVSHSSLNSWS